MNGKQQRWMLAFISIVAMWLMGGHTVYAAEEAQAQAVPPAPAQQNPAQMPPAARYVMSAVPALYTFNVQNADERIKSFQKNFSESGWKEYQTTLETQGVLKRVKAEKIGVRSRLFAWPRMVSQTPGKESTGYQFQAPFMMQYYDAQNKGLGLQHFLANITLVMTGVGQQAQYQITGFSLSVFPTQQQQVAPK